MRYKLFVYILFIITFFSCAKRGNITGGDKDLIPPKIVSSSPKNFSTSFNKNSIKIYFDEYVTVKDLDKNLIISPVMKTQPIINPQGSASKYITIKIIDTLQPNTTYSFNFGESVADNNENNVYKNFKYVVSTGKEIDSLTLEGTIKDAYDKEIPHYVNVMLYEYNEKFNDSTIFKETPRYITNTLDSTNTYKIENIKAGKYKLIALKEKSSNYKFDSKSDKIGFYDQVITIPDKSIYELELFKEEIPLKFKKPIQASGNRILIPYEGNSDGTSISMKYKNSNIDFKQTKLIDKDSIQLWYKPIKNDSVEVSISKGKIKNNFWVKLRNQRNDSLKLLAKNNQVLHLKENLIINSFTPISNYDSSKIKLIKKDSSAVDFKLQYNDFNQNLEVMFEKQSEEKYTLQIQPEAIKDYLGQKNNLFKINFTTKSFNDYGNLKLNLKNSKVFPLIVELTDEKGRVVYSQCTEKNPFVEFLLIEPDKYNVRIIFDSNKNKIWDTGSYMQKLQPEEVFHFPSLIDVRANWDVNQDIDLGK